MQRLSGPHSASALELKERMDAERRGHPFVILRDEHEHQRLVELDEAAGAVSIGRSEQCDIALGWDDKVSRVHAELVPVAGGWALQDGGLSRNGTFVNGQRLMERRRLDDGDTVLVGSTALLFRLPGPSTNLAMTVAAGDEAPVELSAAQRAVLRELCRPFAGGGGWTKPASNPEIAAALVLSLDAVKGHLRVLFAKFGVDALPQNEKRLRLVERALTTGAVQLSELRESSS